MRISSMFLLLLFAGTIAVGSGCAGSNPIFVDPETPGIDQLRFLSRLTARHDSSTGEVWIGAPPGWAMPSSKVLVSVPNDVRRLIRAQPDGSFLYKFPGDSNSAADLEWVDLRGNKRSESIQVSRASDDFEPKIGSAGLYPNRLYYDFGHVWVVNSGDDEFASYDPIRLSKQTAIELPPFSNPWEADFIPFSSLGHANKGFITTLFGGVFYFDPDIGEANEVVVNGFREFASPNGVSSILTSESGDPVTGLAWIANPNPVSYFPTEFGQGFISRVEFDESAHVVGEINTEWLNPQNVITDGNYVYVSCSGTIDFVPPDYIATALDSGGVLAIDPYTSEIVASYDLGVCGPGPMALDPYGRYLYVGSSVAGWIFRIDLENGAVLNDAANPIVISDYPGTYVPFLEVAPTGMMVCASFNTDTLRFIDSRTGELDPFPFFEPIELHPDDPDALWGPQDAVFMASVGHEGLLILTTVDSSFHWLECEMGWDFLY